MLPGAEEIVALLEVHRWAVDGRFDAVLVDCAPSGETLRLLALPETIAFYADRLMGAPRRLLRTLAASLTGGALGGGERAGARRARRPARSADRGPDPADRPGPHRHPDRDHRGASGHRRGQTAAHRAVPARLPGRRGGGQPAPTGRGRRWLPGRPAGGRGLGGPAGERVVRRSADSPPDAGRPGAGRASRRWPRWASSSTEPTTRSAPLRPGPPSRWSGTTAGMRCGSRCPLVERSSVDLTRSGDELVITVGTERRRVALPSLLQRCRVTGARFDGDVLVIGFEPDPARWPEALLDSLPDRAPAASPATETTATVGPLDDSTPAGVPR